MANNKFGYFFANPLDRKRVSENPHSSGTRDEERIRWRCKALASPLRFKSSQDVCFGWVHWLA